MMKLVKGLIGKLRPGKKRKTSIYHEAVSEAFRETLEELSYGSGSLKKITDDRFFHQNK